MRPVLESSRVCCVAVSPAVLRTVRYRSGRWSCRLVRQRRRLSAAVFPRLLPVGIYTIIKTTGSSLANKVEDTEDSKTKDGRRWSINRNPT